jgi:8-oxo-dGTP pyrophosphatase MutT (NUDIX family)
MNTVAVAIVDKLNKPSEVLILERVKDGYGLMVGGKLDDGEEPKIGLIRELFEETNLIAQPENLHYVRSYIDENKVNVDLYILQRSDCQGILDNVEPHKCTRMIWHRFGDKKDFIHPPSFQTDLDMIENYETC